MTPEIRQRTLDLIAAYSLHSTVPVKLWAIEDLFLIRYMDMSSTESLGSIISPPNGWPVSPDNRARILIDHGLSPDEARIVIAHEIGHAMAHHTGAASSIALGMGDRHERQAWEAAALILIPPTVALEERETKRIASVCGVPEWLVAQWQF